MVSPGDDIDIFTKRLAGILRAGIVKTLDIIDICIVVYGRPTLN